MFDIAVVTVDREVPYLHATLASLFASCRSCPVPTVHVVVGTPEDGYLDPYRDHANVRVHRAPADEWERLRGRGRPYQLACTFHRVLGLPLSPGSAGLCVCEDDVAFRDDFVPKLDRTLDEMAGEPWRLTNYLLAVYCPYNYENDPPTYRGRHFGAHHGCRHYGNQCLFVAAAALVGLRAFVRDRGVERNERPVDRLCGQYTCQGGAEMYACSPSLARHIGRVTTGPGPFHDSPTYAFDWDNWEYKQVDGWFDFQDLYAHAVRRAGRRAQFVEVGSFLGRSTCYLAKAIRNAGRDIRLDAVDTWAGSPGDAPQREIVARHGGSVRAAFEENLRRFGLDGHVRPVCKPSTDAAADYADGSLDFVFIDASHRYEDVRGDVRSWLPKVRPGGGLLAGHDYGWDGVRRAVDELLGGRVRAWGNCWVYERQ